MRMEQLRQRISLKSFSTDDAIAGDGLEFIDIWGRLCSPAGRIILFGHFGDSLGRKKTLVLSMLVMGVSTIAIGFLPGYSSVGVFGALLLCACRFVQGIGLGGEWSGAVLVATENAPADKRALYGAFPEVGAPIGFSFVTGCSLCLKKR